MTNSTFDPTCADDGSVNEYVYVHGCMYENISASEGKIRL